MRFRLPSLRLMVFCMLLAPWAASAQDDPPSLGDLARDLRRDKLQQQTRQQPEPDRPGARSVIDNDNLAQATEEARRARPAKSDKTVLSIDSSTNTLKLSSPDVTCSLSFNARASSLLIKPVLIEDLPLAELLKIDGPGSIQDENLQLDVFNGTDWDLREITIGLTLERKPGASAEMAARARVIPAAQAVAPVGVERRSDVTLLYHLKAEAKPFSTTAFHENIGITPGPDEDWRWSIVEAKGIRPAAQAAPDSLQEPLFGTPSFGTPSPVAPESNQPPLAPTAPAIPDKAGRDKPTPTPQR
jgi:hypothetical protein